MIRPEKRTVTYEEWLFDLPINGKEMYDILHQALAEWGDGHDDSFYFYADEEHLIVTNKYRGSRIYD